MALRPIFAPLFNGETLIIEDYVDFKWHPGMSLKQKQRSIAELHKEANDKHGLSRPLEISSKSDQELGVALSSFNLKFTTLKKKITLTVETAFQGSKVFKEGGPFRDIFSMSPKDAKRDPRLRNSGALVGFDFFGVEWDLLPRTAFYDWLYINALLKNEELANDVVSFDYFTDIEFNPERSVNCQARSTALFIALKHRGLIEKVVTDKAAFLSVHTSGVPKPRHKNYHNPLL